MNAHHSTANLSFVQDSSYSFMLMLFTYVNMLFLYVNSSVMFDTSPNCHHELGQGRLLCKPSQPVRCFHNLRILPRCDLMSSKHILPLFYWKWILFSYVKKFAGKTT